MTDGSNFKKPVGFGERIDVRVERRTARDGIVVIRQRIAAHGFVVAWVAGAATDAHRSLLSSAMGKFQIGHYFYLIIE